MEIVTVTQAKRHLGPLLKRVATGAEIGIVSGAEIFALRKVRVVADDRAKPPLEPAGAERFSTSDKN